MYGFTLYSAPHIIILIICAAASVCAGIFYRRASRDSQNKTGFLLAVLLVVLDIAHYIVFYFIGELSVNAIPLHLCAMTIYLILFHSVHLSDWLAQTLYAVCLPGVWSALLFPNWTMYPIFSYPSLHSFTMHCLMSMYIIMQLTSCRIRPRLRAIWKPAVFLVVAAAIAWMANFYLHTNFMFLNRPVPGSPLEPLYNLAGGILPLYLLFFGIFAMIVLVIMYLPFSIYNLIRKRR
ncbi:MAG: YwaF family protein [Lachnospiraceae bacterium]|nr:YwaF family protein [Lachnospiraceae bacterium]